MEVAREKMKDMSSRAKERMEVQRAKSEEKAEKKAAKSREEKEIAHELSKARQAEAKMEYHLERAEHRAERLAHRAAGTNGVSTNSVLTGGGGGVGTFYNGQGQPFAGMPARPGGVAVDAACPPGIGNAGSMDGGMPARPPGGAVYPPGVGNGPSTHGSGGGYSNSYV